MGNFNHNMGGNQSVQQNRSRSSNADNMSRLDSGSETSVSSYDTSDMQDLSDNIHSKAINNQGKTVKKKRYVLDKRNWFALVPPLQYVYSNDIFLLLWIYYYMYYFVQYKTEDWRNEWANNATGRSMFTHMTTPNPTDSINLLKREEQVTIFRLRCQHVPLNAHLKRIE